MMSTELDRLTRSTLFDLICRDGENRKDFSHYLHNRVGHRGSWWHFRVRLKTFEKTLNPHKDINEYILARNYIFSRLTI